MRANRGSSFNLPMPPKAKEKKPTPEEEEEAAAAEAAAYAEELAEATGEALEDIFEAGFRQARNGELDRKRLPHEVGHYMGQLTALTELYFVGADAGRHGPTDEGKPANWRRDAEVTQAMTDMWSRDLLPRHDRTQFRSLQAARKPGEPPPPLPLRPHSRARDSRETQRPSSAQGMHGRSMSAAGTMRPSSAAELRSSGMAPSASQPALVRQSSHSSLASSKKSMMSIEQQLHALHPAMADAHMTDKGVLICKGPPDLQNQLSRRNHIPRVVVDPEQAKINRLQAKLAQERATFQVRASSAS